MTKLTPMLKAVITRNYGIIFSLHCHHCEHSRYELFLCMTWQSLICVCLCDGHIGEAYICHLERSYVEPRNHMLGEGTDGHHPANTTEWYLSSSESHSRRGPLHHPTMVTMANSTPPYSVLKGCPEVDLSIWCGDDPGDDALNYPKVGWVIHQCDIQEPEPSIRRAWPTMVSALCRMTSSGVLW